MSATLGDGGDGLGRWPSGHCLPEHGSGFAIVICVVVLTVGAICFALFLVALDEAFALAFGFGL